MPSLRLEDFSDRELLYAFVDLADEDGTVSSHELADGLRLSSDLKHPHQNVAIRLSWLKRYGMVDRTDDGRWRLTPAGERLMNGKLKAAERRLLEGLAEERIWTVVAAVGNRMLDAPDEAATMAAREFRYGQALRKRIGR